MTSEEPKIILRGGVLVAITPEGERHANPDEVFDWCIYQACKEAWGDAIDTDWATLNITNEQFHRLHASNPYLNPYKEKQNDYPL